MLSLCVSPGPEGSGALTGPDFGGESATLRGQVLNDELLPIEGAQVGILAPQLVVLSDAEGRFVLPGVPPGSITVFASALGYATATKSVDVSLEAPPPDLLFTLVTVPVDGPRHVTDVFKIALTGYGFKATPDCMYTGVHPNAKTCMGGFACEPGPCEVHYGHCGDGSDYEEWGCRLTPDWVTIVGEVQWQPQSGATGRGLTYEILAPNVTRGGADSHSGSVDQGDPRAFVTTSASPPIRTVVDRSILDTRGVSEEDRCGGVGVEFPHCDWAWRAYPGKCTVYGLSGGVAGCDEFGPDFNVDELTPQPVSIYFTFFILAPAPEEWTALPDA